MFFLYAYAESQQARVTAIEESQTALLEPCTPYWNISGTKTASRFNMQTPCNSMCTDRAPGPFRRRKWSGQLPFCKHSSHLRAVRCTFPSLQEGTMSEQLHSVVIPTRRLRHTVSDPQHCQPEQLQGCAMLYIPLSLQAHAAHIPCPPDKLGQLIIPEDSLGSCHTCDHPIMSLS